MGHFTETYFIPAGFTVTDGTICPPKVRTAREAVDVAATLLRLTGARARIVRTAPIWRPGDVVVVRYRGDDGPAYTYVRGAADWPGDRRPKTDAEISALYDTGKVQPVLQAGGVPFDRGRLA